MRREASPGARLLPCILALFVATTLAPWAPPAAIAQTFKGPLRFVPQDPEASVKIHARFPRSPGVCDARQPRNLHAAYKGVMEIGLRPDGRIYLVTELTFPEYLSGIAEVPRNWPLEALKAQVVAARTYAIKHMNPTTSLARDLKYNLCATDACQVYRGLNVERGAWGGAWAQAVTETRGEILKHNGAAADALYFSTSNGTTLSNKDVFRSSPLPYLRPVVENDDGQSPLSNWKVTMPLVDLAATLKRAGAFNGSSIDSVSHKGSTINFAGAGASGSLELDQFRIKLNNHAVCLTPKRYPSLGPDGKPYPQVIPSKWLTLRQEGNNAVIEGRGWGHGVGMVQWGLKGKAEKGMDYRQMLAHYYSGLVPERIEEPGKVRIGLSANIEELTIERRGPVRIDGTAAPEGPIKITGGKSLSVTPGTPIEPVLRLDKVALKPPPPAAPAPGDAVPLAFDFELASPANIEVRLSGSGADQTFSEPRDRGPQTISVNPGPAMPPGPYQALITAKDGVDDVASGPFPVTVERSSTPLVTPSPSPSPTVQPRAAGAESGNRSEGSPGIWLSALAAGLLIFTLGIGLWIRRRV